MPHTPDPLRPRQAVIPAIAQLSKDGQGLPIPPGRSIINFREGTVKHVESLKGTARNSDLINPDEPLGQYRTIHTLDDIERFSNQKNINGFSLVYVVPDADVKIQIYDREPVRVEAGSAIPIRYYNFDEIDIEAEQACLLRGIVTDQPKVPQGFRYDRSMQRQSTEWDTGVNEQDNSPVFLPSRLLNQLYDRSGTTPEGYGTEHVKIAPYDEVEVRVTVTGANSADVFVETTNVHGRTLNRGDFTQVASATGVSDVAHLSIDQPAQHLRVEMADGSGNTTGKCSISAR